jgi:hypothetical protein
MFDNPSPIEARPAPAVESPFMNRCYLHTTRSGSDPSMTWGSEVDMTMLQEWIAAENLQSETLITPMSVLIRAVGMALAKCPEFNVRILGSGIHRFMQVNALVPCQRPCGGPTLCLLRDIDRKTPGEIARELWAQQRSIAQGDHSLRRGEWILSSAPPFIARRLVRLLLWVSNHVHKPMDPVDTMLRGAPVVINHFNFRGAPPLTAYKPSRFDTLCSLLNVTLGPTSLRPCVVDGRIEARPLAGLFVRADHRIIDARDLARFTGTTVELLTHPELCGDHVHFQRAETTPEHPLAAAR